MDDRRLIDPAKFKAWLDVGHLRSPTELCFSELDVSNMIDKQPSVEALIPPCRPWDKVWIIDKTPDLNTGNMMSIICEGEIYKLSYNGFTEPMEWIDYRWDSPLVGQTSRHDRIDLCLGKTVFLTREEAEKKLSQLTGGSEG